MTRRDAPGFSPYVLFRRGTLALPSLSGLVPARTWSLLAEAEQAGVRRAELRVRLEDELHRAVPGLSAEHRGSLLAVRRAVHNDRIPAICPAIELLSARCRELLAQWSSACGEGRALTAEAEHAFAAELETGRKTLAEVAMDEDFRRGIQLSGEEVYREVTAYAADPFDTRRKPSRRRRVESTITSFAYRVVFKPSPFGSFTEIGAQPWSTTPAVNRLADARTSRVRLNIGLLTWMAHQLHRLDHAEDLLCIRLNNSLAVRGERAVFVRRPLDGAADAFAPDRVLSARHTNLVRLLVREIGAHQIKERDLRERLVVAGLAPESVAGTLDQLVELGLCHRGLGLPDQTTGYAGTVARRLRRFGTAQANACADIFERMQSIEDSYAGASAGRRTELLAELRDLVHRFVAVCGCHPPAKEAMRAAVYEDVGTRAAATSWQPELLERNRENFALFQRLLPVLDDAGIEKLGLYRFFAERYGEDAEGVAFTELYRAFAELPASAAGAVMSGMDDPYSHRIRLLRDELFDQLGEQLTAEPPGGELVLDPEPLRAFADRLPATLPPWRCTAFRLQIDRELMVVNGVTTGHGVFFSRFCDLLEPEERGAWSLREELRGHLARTAPRQADITAVLGLNFNLHPRLTCYELIYPGSVAREGAEHVLTLADLEVRADSALRRLVLTSTVDGRPIDLVPLNFLYPAAAPTLYRFLCAFAPTRTYRGGLWEQLDRAERTVPATGRPRVLLGDLVLDRRSWRFGVDQLPALDGLERQELTALARFDRWRCAIGMPRTGFFRVLAAPSAPSGERDLVAETRTWALQARSARLHKPHFVDTRNPFLMQVLGRQARAMPGGSVLFQECLPAAQNYEGPQGPTSAEEFFVEFADQRSDHGIG